MNNDTKYEIFIGCNDQQTKENIVSDDELLEIVNEYFKKKKINYSAQRVEGGYLFDDKTYVLEKTIYVIIIGDQNFDIVKFAKGLSMYMNQECFMITKGSLKTDYR